MLAGVKIPSIGGGFECYVIIKSWASVDIIIHNNIIYRFFLKSSFSSWMYIHPSCSHHIVRDCMVDWTHCLCRRHPPIPPLFCLLLLLFPSLFCHKGQHLNFPPFTILSYYYVIFSFYLSIFFLFLFPFILEKSLFSPFFLCLMCISVHLLLSFLGLIQISPSLVCW